MCLSLHASYVWNFVRDMHMLRSCPILFGCYNKSTIQWRHINNRIWFPTIVEAGKFKYKVLTNLGSGESSLSGSQMTAFFLCLHLAKKKIYAEVSGAPFIRVPTASLKGPASWLNHPPKAPSPYHHIKYMNCERKNHQTIAHPISILIECVFKAKCVWGGRWAPVK